MYFTALAPMAAVFASSRGERQGNRVYKLRGCSQPPRRLCFPFEFFPVFGKDKGFPFFAISFSGAVFAKEGEDLPLFHVKGHILYPPDAAVFLAQFFHIKQKNPPSAHYMRAGRDLDAESAVGSPA